MPIYSLMVRALTVVVLLSGSVPLLASEKQPASFAIDSLSPPTSVCDSNSYALCSHAKCDCLGADGQPGECEYFNPQATGTDRDTGWSSCECALVEQSVLSSESAYRANFSNLPCQELAAPSSKGTAFPSYRSEATKLAYSTYSFGDSLPGKDFGTLDSAELKLCDTQAMMALCLNMPCEEVDGKTICYCQNVGLNQCPSNAWNTLGTDCQSDRCAPGKNKLWSAACITDTMAGISQLTVYLRQHVDPNFVTIPNYCPQ